MASIGYATAPLGADAEGTGHFSLALQTAPFYVGRHSASEQQPWEEPPPTYVESVKSVGRHGQSSRRMQGQSSELSEKRLQIFLERLKPHTVFATELEAQRGESSTIQQAEILPVPAYGSPAVQRVGKPLPQPQEFPKSPNATETQQPDLLLSQASEVADSAPGTCQWIYQREAFIRWRQPQGEKVLLLLADPGVGKTVLAKSILTELKKQNNIVHAFFCRSDDGRRNSTTSVIASFVYNLLNLDRELATLITDSMIDKNRLFSLDNLWDLFLRLNQNRTGCTFIIDALDECQQKSQQKLREALGKSATELSCKILITARRERHPQALSRDFASIEIDPETTSQDVTLFLDHELKLKRIANLYSSREMISLLKEIIESGAEGMFLYVSFQLEEFLDTCDELDFETTQEYLHSFFSRSPGRFKDYYGRMMDDIIQNKGTISDKAVTIFNILLAVKVHPTNEDLAAAYYFSRNNTANYDEYKATKELDMFDSAKRICGPILRIRCDEYNRNTISIVHPTAREFLEDGGKSFPSGARSQLLARIDTKSGHVLMANACLRFLLLPEMAFINSQSLADYPFLAYAVSYWPIHVRESQERVVECKELLSEFFAEGCAAYREWAAFTMSAQDGLVPAAVLLEPPDVCITLVEYGLQNLVQAIAPGTSDSPPNLFGLQIDVDAVDDSGMTALIMAIESEQLEVADKLLLLGASATEHSPDGITPLHAAAIRDSEALVRQLISMGAEVDGPVGGDDDSDPPLFRSMENSLEMFVLLLDLGAQGFKRSSDDLTILHKAALLGNFEMVKVIFQRGLIEDVDAKCDGGITALHFAAGNGKSLEITKYLVTQKGASVDMVSDLGTTPLYAAVYENNRDIISFLLPLTKGRTIGGDGWTPLHAAVRSGDVEVVQMLIDERVGLNLTAGTDTCICKAGVSPLYIAAWGGYLEIVKRLVATRALRNDIDKVEDTLGYTPLLAALSQNRAEVAHVLLSAGADRHKTSVSQWSSLHLVCSSTKDEGLVECLVSDARDDEISARTNDGLTPLHLAAEKGFTGAIRILLARGADPLARNRFSSMPLSSAAYSGSSTAVDLLMKVDHLPDAQDQFGRTALHYAAEGCDGPTLKKLVDATNWTCRYRSGPTPLNCAVGYGRLEALVVLLEAGMPLSMVSTSGWTALHSAAALGNEVLVRELLARGAGLNVTNNFGVSPAYCAYGHGNSALSELLTLPTRDSARLHKYNLRGCLHQASNSLSAVQRLLGLGVPANVKDAMNVTPLSLAARDGNSGVVEYLLKQPGVASHVNLKSLLGGTTPLHAAAERSNVQCVKILVEQGRADVRIKDLWGFTAIDYATDSEIVSLIRKADPTFYTMWRTEIQGRNCEQGIIHQLCVLIRWIRQQQNSRPSRPFLRYYMDYGYDLLCEWFITSHLEDHPSACTAIELSYSLVAHRRARTVYYEFSKNFKISGRYLYRECKDRTAVGSIKDCYGRESIEVLSPPRYERNPTHVNDECRTEEARLESLEQHYESLRDPEFDCTQLPTLVTDYEESRQSVFELCRHPDLNDLSNHLQEYPRDVAIRDEAGTTTVMTTIDVGTSDSDTLHQVQLLCCAGVQLLVRNANKVSSVQLACEKGFERTLTFLLEQFDPEFDADEEDHYGPKALKIMIGKGWDSAIRATIERHFDWAARHDYSWLQDLPMLSITDEQIVALLSTSGRGDVLPSGREKPSSPWADFQQPSGDGEPAVDFHHSDCVHDVSRGIAIAAQQCGDTGGDKNDDSLDASFNPDTDDDDEDEVASYFSESSSITETVAGLCGLAGVFPHGSGSAAFSVPDTGDSEVSISYYCGYGSPVIGTLLSAGKGLLQAMASAQSSRLCCNAFTVLHPSQLQSENSRSILRLSRIPFQTVADFVGSIKDAPQHQSSIIQAQHLANSAQIANSILNLCNINLEIEGYGDVECLEVSCLAMQFLCLGFLSFLAGHLSKFQMPILTSRISRFLLHGYKGQKTIVMESRKMECVGKMLEDDVFAFFLQDLHTQAHEPLSQNPEKCYLLASAEDIIELWGPGTCIGKKNLDGAIAEPFVAIDICGGYIALDGGHSSGHRTAHWSQDPAIINQELSLFASGESLLVGTLPVNEDCLLDMSEAFATANIGHLVPLDTHEPYWTLAMRQLSAQLTAQYVGLTVGAGYKKRRGLSEKQAVIKQWNDRLLLVLNKPWGLFFSVCTGIAKRVPLREAIAEVLQLYLRDIDPYDSDGTSLPDDWEGLKERLMRELKGDPRVDEEANSTRYVDFMKHGLPGKKNCARRVHLRTAITFVLQYLQQTGVDEAGSVFRIAWAGERDPLRAIKLSCSENGSGWTKILRDSAKVATFAVATSDCLVTHLTRHPFSPQTSCRCINHSVALPAPLQLIQTKVLPCQPGESIVAGWKLHESSHYSFEVDSTTNIICKLWRVGSRRFLVVFYYGELPNAIFHGIQKLLVDEEKLKENHQSYTSDVPKDVLVCSNLKWRQANNLS
ncbi:MAG: hypothetical protein M1813_007945 [Trichoglossum hirsutum]|nr:MAG: hypothetical protein M1813_007945 [Trichoglossum hirsutum]